MDTKDIQHRLAELRAMDRRLREEWWSRMTSEERLVVMRRARVTTELATKAKAWKWWKRRVRMFASQESRSTANG